MSLTGYAQTKAAQSNVPRIRPVREVGLKQMKLSWRQRLANWLTDSRNDAVSYQEMPEESINSHGMRFNLYKASGGYVIETRVYDENHDRNRNKLYVITEDKDLGDELGKIITMESLR